MRARSSGTSSHLCTFAAGALNPSSFWFWMRATSWFLSALLKPAAWTTAPRACNKAHVFFALTPHLLRICAPSQQVLPILHRPHHSDFEWTKPADSCQIFGNLLHQPPQQEPATRLLCFWHQHLHCFGLVHLRSRCSQFLIVLVILILNERNQPILVRSLEACCINRRNKSLQQRSCVFGINTCCFCHCMKQIQNKYASKTDQNGVYHYNETNAKRYYAQQYHYKTDQNYNATNAKQYHA